MRSALFSLISIFAVSSDAGICTDASISRYRYQMTIGSPIAPRPMRIFPPRTDASEGLPFIDIPENTPLLVNIRYLNEKPYVLLRDKYGRNAKIVDVRDGKSVELGNETSVKAGPILAMDIDELGRIALLRSTVLDTHLEFIDIDGKPIRIQGQGDNRRKIDALFPSDFLQGTVFRQSQQVFERGAQVGFLPGGKVIAVRKRVTGSGSSIALICDWEKTSGSCVEYGRGLTDIQWIVSKPRSQAYLIGTTTEGTQKMMVVDLKSNRLIREQSLNAYQASLKFDQSLSTLDESGKKLYFLAQSGDLMQFDLESERFQSLGSAFPQEFPIDFAPSPYNEDETQPAVGDALGFRVYRLRSEDGLVLIDTSLGVFRFDPAVRRASIYALFAGGELGAGEQAVFFSRLGLVWVFQRKGRGDFYLLNSVIYTDRYIAFPHTVR